MPCDAGCRIVTANSALLTDAFSLLGARNRPARDRCAGCTSSKAEVMRSQFRSAQSRKRCAIPLLSGNLLGKFNEAIRAA
jgi:hypothetical protein